MEFQLSIFTARGLVLSALAFVALLAPGYVIAQGIELSPEQQQMLNALPPAQRQQAVNAIRQMQSQQSTQPSQTINEPLVSNATTVDDIEALLAEYGGEAEAGPGSRIVLTLTPNGDLTAQQRRSLEADPLLSRLAGSRLHILDGEGVLVIEGADRVPLLGLTESEVNRRLGAEPYLSLFNIDARILGQKLVGVEALEPFGYDVFRPDKASLDSPASGPVPADYVLGPGDTVRVQLFGNVNNVYEYEVSRDGILNLPDIGPVAVAGIRFSELRADLDKRVRQTMIGTQVSVTMGQLRTIRVFLLGEVDRPGSYVVGGLSTISSALYHAGGISDIGSLRRIQLKRDGDLVATFDAYDMLVRGDTSDDQRLLPGDVIFVPPVGMTVGVAGAVNRPAIYEVGTRTTAADLVGLAGGLKPEAYAAGARIERIEANSERSIVSIDLAGPGANDLILRPGDTLIVPEVLPDVGNAVVLEGHVHRPGDYSWKPGMRLTDLIGSVGELKSGVDTDYVLIRREQDRGAPVRALSASLAKALANPSSPANIELRPRDTVYVFDLAAGRQRVVAPLLDELQLQATIDAPARRVEISGTVRAPGEYPLESGMRISDLLRAGGNLSESAFGVEAELTRYSLNPDGARVVEIIQINLDAIRRGDSSADIVLSEHDYLIVNRVPEWDSIWTVQLDGEVKFPGIYRVRRGETLMQVIERAGGLTGDAFAEGAVFLRDSLRRQEQEQIEALAKRLESDLLSLSLQSANSVTGTDTLSTGRALLEQLRDTEATGRLVIDLPQVLAESGTPIEMRDGDRLIVPSRTQVVTVLGETQQNSSHVYKLGMSRDDYIDLSGGLTRRADRKLIYVVRANGAVVTSGRTRWLGRGAKVDIRPGDTIVVPLDTDRMRPLTFWTNVTQMLYQGAIAVAAIRSFED